MNPLILSKLVFSYTEGWDELKRERPSVAAVFLRLVLPLALLPPAMLWMAGSAEGERHWALLDGRPLALIVAIVFFAEIATVPLMAWVTRIVAEVGGLRVGRHESALLACLAPAPLWLAALALASPNPAVLAAAAVLAVFASASLVHRGCYALLGFKDELRAFMAAFNIYAPGVLAWLLLLAVILLL